MASPKIISRERSTPVCCPNYKTNTKCRYFIVHVVVELSSDIMRENWKFRCWPKNALLGTLSSQDESVDDDERRRVRSGSRTSSKAGKTNV